ncbi:hypothetical protein FEE95_21400 [Maribacter algarum]|uniref:Uncharacterized protein n=1 Tax=Maribacter algarum (ex Zhang et al. 2020) TaxID=2578118 RepID=A0A5S3PIW3_9FLAO|nr:hypothetical protein [Maribacter algarum]TMM51975.1 hypothetical protein FEE95_21400 [Maribacter algarum]
MIAKIYIKGLIVLMTCFSSNQFDTVNGKLNSSRLREQLATDFLEILEFSEKMKLYGITQENFESFFHKGALESFNFHQSSHYMKQSNLNRMIERELINYQDLKHPLKKPSKSNSKNLKVRSVLNTFSGEWSGKWKSMPVRHLWLPFKEINLEINELFKIIGFQTCFTGDGFGWNYLIQKGEETIILGHVYHFNTIGKLDYENPHYALVNNQSQLTWVSDNHIYYEFVCDNKKHKNERHYVITALPYSRENKLKFGTPIQAIYTSRNSVNNSTKIKKPLNSVPHYKAQ